MRWEIEIDSECRNKQLNLLKSKQMLDALFGANAKPLRDDGTIIDTMIKPLRDDGTIIDTMIKLLELGETVSGYIKKVRLKKATYLLKCTDKDIACIAREVGFNSEYYFSTDFKKNVGMSPGSYRKNNSRLSE